MIWKKRCGLIIRPRKLISAKSRFIDNQIWDLLCMLNRSLRVINFSLAFTISSMKTKLYFVYPIKKSEERLN